MLPKLKVSGERERNITVLCNRLSYFTSYSPPFARLTPEPQKTRRRVMELTGPALREACSQVKCPDNEKPRDSDVFPKTPVVRLPEEPVAEPVYHTSLCREAPPSPGRRRSGGGSAAQQKPDSRSRLLYFFFFGEFPGK